MPAGLQGLPLLPRPWVAEVTKSSDYTVLNTDHGTLFLTGGGANRTFTLPALASGVGCVWYFYNVQANNMIITAPSNKLIGVNNATGTTATFSTANQIIGSMAMVWMNDAGTFYHIASIGGTTNTMT